MDDLNTIRTNGYFSFLNNSELEEELYLCMAYLSYLIDQLDKMDSSSPSYLRFSISHNIVISYCAILEAILHEYVKIHFIVNNDEENVAKFCKIVTYKEITQLISKNGDPETGIVYCERKTKHSKFKNRTQLNELIKGCKKHGLITDNIAEKIDKIRLIRNGVHITALMDVKDIFTYSDLDNIRGDVRKIFISLRKKITDLNKILNT